MADPIPDPTNTPAAPKGSVYKHMLRGSLWALGQNFSIRLIGLFNTIILARLLAPDDFGLVTMATMVMGFINSFVDLGPSALLMRQPHATREHCDTAWTFSFLRGVAVALILAALSPWIADYFREERVVAITLILAINSLIANGFSIGLILLRKELHFATEFYFGLACRLVVLVVTLSLAFWLRSYWAIVAGALCGNIFGLILSYKVHPYRARISFAKAREYINFSLVMIPLNAASYLTARVDTFVVGRMSTAAVLGVYNVAAELATMLTIDLMQQISRGLYPNFAKLLHDRPKLIEAYLGAMSALATVSIAFGLGLWAVSADFVRVVLGEKWLDAIPLLQWLAIGGTLRGIDFSLGTAILTVAGYERTSAVLMWMRLALYTAGSIVGGMWAGQMGVAIGIVVASAIFIPVVILCLILRFDLRIADFVRALWRPVPAGLAMIFVVRLLHPDSLPIPILRLFIDIIVGGLVFALTLFVLWHISGRPTGIESRVLSTVMSKLKTIRN
jgi:lipopolysaccharide exporter